MRHIRVAFEQLVKPQDSHETRMAGVYQFVDRFRTDLGLTENEYGRPVVRDAKMSPREFSIRGLAESLIGPEWNDLLARDINRGAYVFEAGGNPAIAPGMIPNVSAFLGSVVGLLDAAIIAGYEKPEYIIDKLVYTEPTKVRQRKFIGTGRVGDKAMRRNPGDPHAFAQFTERYSTSPETFNDALATAVTFEAIFFDQTGEIMDRANSIGEELGLRKELDGMRMIAGVTNPYNYGGTAYNTYLTAGNWVNDIATNPLVDWTNIDVVRAVFSRMTDQETGNRVTIVPDTMLVSPAKLWTAKHIAHQTEIETRTQGDGQGNLQARRGSYDGDRMEPLQSPYMDQVLTTADTTIGLNLSQANADKYWWAIKTGPKGAFYRTENWGVNIQRASPNDYVMLNQKIVLAVFADYMHAFGVRDPRFVVRSKN